MYKLPPCSVLYVLVQVRLWEGAIELAAGRLPSSCLARSIVASAGAWLASALLDTLAVFVYR